MQFDDRLATVLRTRISSAAGERTQLRQLLDLLGSASPASPAEAAFERLAQLRESLPLEDQTAILRDSGLRLRNPRLIAVLADGEPRVAAAALASARLDDAAWQGLIPRLPITARSLLRHRRDLPPGATRLLEQLGVGDLVLSDGRDVAEAEPAFAGAELPAAEESAVPQPKTAPAGRVAATGAEPIGELIERIEQFRSARRIPVLAPRLPLGDAAPSEAARIDAFDVVTDAAGQAIWASAVVAPWIVGMALTGPRHGPLAALDSHTLTALRLHQPLAARPVTLTGAPAISGDWRMHAAPVFGPESGAFCGYRCRLLRAIPAPAPALPADSHADRMRQVLHELRTPVNAIQGFAEIIQQQLFGPVPHAYRAHAAEIAVDAARLLAGFEDIERLAQLESGVTVPETGEADLRLAVDTTLARLAGMLAARGAGFAMQATGETFAVALAPSEAQALCWRILASAAGAMADDEQVTLTLASDAHVVRLELQLPAVFGVSVVPLRPSAGSGMLGPQFAFRLATAEARAAGGGLSLDGGQLVLTLPSLTGSGNNHSKGVERARG